MIVSVVRRMVVKEEQFIAMIEKLSIPASGRPIRSRQVALRSILLLAYDTGMRKEEVLSLKWSQVDLGEGRVLLSAQDTKTNEGRMVYLTSRALEALRIIPRNDRSEYVFVNPCTGRRWKDLRKTFRSACKGAGLAGVWFHDTRRSFTTNARRRGVPESVVMRMTGHKTRAVFDRYNIVEDEDVRRAVERIEAGATAETSLDILRQETRQGADLTSE